LDMSPFMQPVLDPTSHSHNKSPRTLMPDGRETRGEARSETRSDSRNESASTDAPTVTFQNLGLAAPIQAALVDENYTIPTPIQAKAIPTILEGRDILGCAQTGTGKTAAFALPVLSRLLSQPLDKSHKGSARPRVLVLSPTRELATQIGDSFATYGKHTGLTHTVIFGGVSQFHQVRALHRGVDIIVATPGRLLDLMEQRLTNFSDIHTFILDEADRMLDMGFIQPIRRIAAAVPAQRQTLLFSATMPKEIMHLADSLLRDPVKVSVSAVATAAPLIEQSLYMVHQKSKPALLRLLLEDETMTRVVVFIRTKHGANKLSTALERAGVDSVAIHGNKSQNQRERALDLFRAGRSRVLVATDVAARGLDVDGVSHVINYDLPMEPEAYVHRIGRTGRAGATGVAIAFCDREEQSLLNQIEKVMRKRIPLKPTPQLPESTIEIRQPVARGQGGHGGRGGRDDNSRLYDDAPRQSRRGPSNPRMENTVDPVIPHRERRSPMPDMHRDTRPAHATGHHGDDHGSTFAPREGADARPTQQQPKPRSGTPRHEMAKRAALDARTNKPATSRPAPRGDRSDRSDRPRFDDRPMRPDSRPAPRGERTDRPRFDDRPARPDARPAAGSPRPAPQGDKKIGGKFAHKYGSDRPRPMNAGGAAPRGDARPSRDGPRDGARTGATGGRSDYAPRPNAARPNSGGPGKPFKKSFNKSGKPSQPFGNRGNSKRG